MIKNFVLDTNVLLYDPQAIFKFEENNIIIPITVIEEIDRFKKDMNETGRNARQLSRYLDEMRATGSLANGIALETGGTLRVEMYEEKFMKVLPPELREERGDNRILAVALRVKEQDEATPVIFVTKDTNLRIKSDALGLKAEDYESDKVDIEELYPGFTELEASAEMVDRFHGQGWVDLPATTCTPTSSSPCAMRPTPPTLPWENTALTRSGSPPSPKTAKTGSGASIPATGNRPLPLTPCWTTPSSS